MIRIMCESKFSFNIFIQKGNFGYCSLNTYIVKGPKQFFVV